MASNFTTAGVAIGGEFVTALAWANFDGTGTVSIRDSYGFSSLTDLAVGNWELNFSSTLGNANYVVSSSGNIGSYGDQYGSQAFGTTKFQFNCSSDSAYKDQSQLNATVFGDG